MRIAEFMLRTYRFPIPELIVVGITALIILSFGTASTFLSTENAYEIVSMIVGLPNFVAVVVLAVFLWNFISMIRGPLINTILSLPLSRLDIYSTYLMGSIVLPLIIVTIPTIVTYLTISPHLGKDLAIAMLSVLANAAMIFSAASTAGILTKSRGIAVGLLITLWIFLPIMASLSMTLALSRGVGAKLTNVQLIAIACLNPSSVVHYAVSKGMDVGSILIGSGLVNLAIALVLLTVAGYRVAKRWEPA